MQLSKLRPSLSLVVASLALAVATGGTSYAAMTIGTTDIRDNSVRSKDIRDETIKNKDLKPNARSQATRWALVGADGQIIRQSGGFSVTAGYPELEPTPTDPTGMRANGNVYIDSGEDLTDNGITATVALQNTVDQDGNGNTNGRAPGSDENAEFSGEIAVAQCEAGIVNCAPPGTANPNTLVVSPRLSDGSATDDTNRKRFYVFVS